MRYPSSNDSDRNTTHLERMRAFLQKQKNTYAKKWFRFSEQYFNDFLMEYVDWSEPRVVYHRLDFTKQKQHFNLYKFNTSQHLHVQLMTNINVFYQ